MTDNLEIRISVPYEDAYIVIGNVFACGLEDYHYDMNGGHVYNTLTDTSGYSYECIKRLLARNSRPATKYEIKKYAYIIRHYADTSVGSA